MPRTQVVSAMMANRERPKLMRSCISLLLMVAVCILLTDTGTASAWGNVPLQTKIPELKLPSTSGEIVTVSVGTAKAMLLIYIRANHDRSTHALTDLIQLYGKYKARNVKALAVSTVREDGEAIKVLAKKLKVPFPVLLDKKEEFYGRYGVFIHPVTGVVDGKGILRYEYSSHRPDYPIAVERQLKAVLGLGPPPEEYKDIDRNSYSKEELKKRRQDKLKEMEIKVEIAGLRRRMGAVKNVLSEDNLELALKLHDQVVSKLPPPEDKDLAAAAQQVPIAKDLSGVITKLRKLVTQKTTRAEAQLWLGRALVRQKKNDEAGKTFTACATEATLKGQCSFELCRLLSTSDAAKALEHCKKGCTAALEE